MLLFLIFIPRPTPDSDPALSSDEVTHLPTVKEAIAVLAVSLSFFVFVILGSLVFIYPAHAHVRAWTNSLGLLGTTLAAIQYIPQIITTWKRQSVGSLSVPMMCIQTPGSFVFAASLAARLGPGGWSAWGLFILTGCLQGCLLGMSLVFWWRERMAAKKGAGRGVNGGLQEGSDERTPLVGNARMGDPL